VHSQRPHAERSRTPHPHDTLPRGGEGEMNHGVVEPGAALVPRWPRADVFRPFRTFELGSLRSHRGERTGSMERIDRQISGIDGRSSVLDRGGPPPLSGRLTLFGRTPKRQRAGAVQNLPAYRRFMESSLFHSDLHRQAVDGEGGESFWAQRSGPLSGGGRNGGRSPGVSTRGSSTPG
jgi:hypothetical protein